MRRREPVAGDPRIRLFDFFFTGPRVGRGKATLVRREPEWDRF